MNNKKECCVNSEVNHSEVKKENSIKDKKNKQFISWSSIVVTVVLLLLALLTIAQTVQTATIYKKINSSSFGNNSSSDLNSASLQNLPDMVGGC